MKDDRLYLIYISECIGRIENYTSGGMDSFLSSSMVQDAVLRNLHTLAESTQRLSERLRRQHNEIDWRAISGFRNLIVHDYLGVDFMFCWKIIEKDIPMLKKAITEMLENN